MGKLSDSQLREWMAAGVPIVGKADGHGLTFTLSRAGTAAWTLRYRFGGKVKELTLGRYPELSLVDARRLADAERQRIASGRDVAAEKADSRRSAGWRCLLAQWERELLGCESAMKTKMRACTAISKYWCAAGRPARALRLDCRLGQNSRSMRASMCEVDRRLLPPCVPT